MNNTLPYHNNFFNTAVGNAEKYEYNTDVILNSSIVADSLLQHRARQLAQNLVFRPVTQEDMPRIFEILKEDTGRTTDFSYGGILMWVKLFDYQFAIIEDTLFIRGHVENDFSKYAFSLPIGSMDLTTAVTVLKYYCLDHDSKLIFSAVPEYALEEFRLLNPLKIEEIENMGDYLYSAEKLSTLSGKKYNKKRNHVNQFLAAFPDWTLEPLTAANATEAVEFMDAIDKEGDSIPMAVIERSLNREVLSQIIKGDTEYIGAILRGNGKMLGFTIGDIKGDTLFVHIEKALRDAPGAFEMINKAFAQYVVESHPEIAYINREDDSGDMGLRLAKQSYHPVEILKKYNVIFE